MVSSSRSDDSVVTSPAGLYQLNASVLPSASQVMEPIEPPESLAGVCQRCSAPLAVDATTRFWTSFCCPCRTYVEYASLVPSGDTASLPIGAMSAGIGSLAVVVPPRSAVSRTS